jgi:hypothetical protein
MRIATVTCALAVVAAVGAPPGKAAAGDGVPLVTGPITGGEHGRPFTAAIDDLASVGYREDEYFLEGQATAFAPKPGTALGSDGVWSVAPGAPQAYKTRILVRRPIDPKRFNGTVVVEWMQSSAGFDKDVNWNWQNQEFIRSGNAWVGVSAQRQGVDGSPPSSTNRFKDLVRWDGARYGSLHIPSEGLSYDIFSQVGRVVGPNRPKAPVDAMGGLAVQKVLPIGDTFAADHLVVYYDAVQPLAHVFDGFFIGWRHISGGAALAEDIQTPSVVRLRTDLAAPVIVVNTMAESLPHLPARQPDSDHYRLWEIAGAAHTNAYWAPKMFAIMHRDFAMPIPVCPQPFNSVPNQYVMNAAVRWLDRWVRGGGAPPVIAPLTISGSPPTIVPDSFGNSAGGARLPEVTVPIARYEAGGDPNCPGGSGFTRAFPRSRLKTLYPAAGDYLAKYTAAAREAVQAGYLLPPDAEEAVAEARRMDASIAR